MSATHIPPFDNKNQPIIVPSHAFVSQAVFNILKLSQQKGGEPSQCVSYYRDYETMIVPATGTIEVVVEGHTFSPVGKRCANVWDQEPEGVYVPTNTKAHIVCLSEQAEVFIGGAKYDQTLEPFAVLANDIDQVQYGSDDTKTHRKIKHILGQQQAGRVGRLLVSELYTVGKGGWSGFPPHTHSVDRLPEETCHHEVYHFRFNPEKGFGLQMWQKDDDGLGEAFHIVNGSTFAFDNGYHPCVVAPGYEMYYFTILAGATQRPLIQHFHPAHAWQVKTIPGLQDMIDKFK